MSTAIGAGGRMGPIRDLARHRRSRTLTAKDLGLLGLLRCPADQPYRHEQKISALQEELALLRQGFEKLGCGLIIVRAGKSASRMTEGARHLLAEYFGSSRQPDRLPDILERWLPRQTKARGSTDTRGSTGRGPDSWKPLLVNRADKCLVVRPVSAPDRTLLILHEQQPTRPETLMTLGLSKREAEVLAWVTEGKTNAEIATILGTSARTVDKHLERVYRKFNVETRTAAASRAIAIGSPTSAATGP
jgi:DNA-binding CsgD family transcriptional regulator